LCQEPTQQGQVVIPNGFSNVPGSAYTLGPFQGLNTYLIQVYDASQFSEIAQGAYLTGVSFRAQEGGSPFDATYSHFEVQMATFARPINKIDTAFSPGFYPDTTITFSRDNVHLSGSASTKPDVPAPFGLHITFDKPFLYNPKNGNLLMYLHANELLSGTQIEVDTEGSLLPPVAYFAAGIVNGPSFGRVDVALISKFDYTAVPEPASAALLLVGMLLFVLQSIGIASNHVSVRFSPMISATVMVFSTK
jgi:hypothetical protein